MANLAKIKDRRHKLCIDPGARKSQRCPFGIIGSQYRIYWRHLHSRLGVAFCWLQASVRKCPTMPWMSNACRGQGGPFQGPWRSDPKVRVRQVQVGSTIQVCSRGPQKDPWASSCAYLPRVWHIFRVMDGLQAPHPVYVSSRRPCFGH